LNLPLRVSILSLHISIWGRRGRGRMVVGFTTMYLACRVFPKNRLPAKLTVSNDFLAGSNGKKKIREKKMSNK
jgi:hypothetical protein